LVQVCESLADPRTRRREVSALRDAMADLNLRSSVIVTRGELGDAGGERRIPVDSGTIEVVAGWRFVLGLC
ncbi:MAG: ATP-binding protein, partial [Gammaproteobacteria bacterium]|nr:ATP-binding protein [Gammaproteobacteria bacterium]